MKLFVIFLSIIGMPCAAQATPIKWRITFDQGNSGYFSYDPATEAQIDWRTLPYLRNEEHGFDFLTEHSITVNTLISYDWSINGRSYSNQGTFWWHDDIGQETHSLGSINHSAVHASPASEKLNSGWNIGHGHSASDLDMSFSEISATRASGSWYGNGASGEFSASRVSSIPLPGAILLFESSLLGIFLFKKNQS